MALWLNSKKYIFPNDVHRFDWRLRSERFKRMAWQFAIWSGFVCRDNVMQYSPLESCQRVLVLSTGLVGDNPVASAELDRLGAGHEHRNNTFNRRSSR